MSYSQKYHTDGIIIIKLISIAIHTKKNKNFGPCIHAIFHTSCYCARLENLHTPPTERNGISWRVGAGSVRPKNSKKCVKLCWNFQRGGGRYGYFWKYT